MSKKYIAFLDSGIGGLWLFNRIIKRFPAENYIYLGDNNNAPYGRLSVNKLRLITLNNISILNDYKIKCLIVACNTLSVTLLQEIKSIVDYPVFGVFPPTEYANTQGGRTLLLATELTARQYNNNAFIDIVGFKNLVNDIENCNYSFESVSFTNHLLKNSVGRFVNEKNYYKTVILGCTHYNYIKNQIFNHFQPQKMISGDDFTYNVVCKFIQSLKSSYIYYGNRILFLGNNALKNKDFMINSGQFIKL